MTRACRISMVCMRGHRLEEKRMRGADERNDQHVAIVMNAGLDSRMGDAKGSRPRRRGGTPNRPARASGPGDRRKAQIAAHEGLLP